MKKRMIVFYSRRGENHYDGGLKFLEIGNTERVAGIIAETLNCGSFRVERAVPYAEGYRACCGEAVAEWKAGARPEIEGFCDDIMEADVIFVGYPIWCGTMPHAHVHLPGALRPDRQDHRSLLHP
jgi:flavodoxin